MKRVAAFLTALLFALVLPASARTPVAPATTAINPALFVVRDADSTIYLFGTIHLRRPGADWGGANAQAAFAEADEVWFELDGSAEGQAEVGQLMRQYGMAPEDQPLSSLLSAEENAQLAAVARQYGVSPAMFDQMRPWMAAMMLSIIPMLQSGYAADAGVDHMIETAATAAGKTRRAFETAELQIQFLANMSAEAQREMLLEAIVDAGKGTAELDALAEAWARGDLEALERDVIDDTRENYPEMYDIMFVRRNNAWVATLGEELEGSGVDFVAVGAGHLLGEHGLVEQLRARGFSVERVSPAE